MEAWRQRVIDEAQTWLRTPWMHNQCVKGAGVDCGRLLIGVHVAAGLVEEFDVGEYQADWMLHQAEERYLGWVLKYMDEVDKPKPADVAMWHFGKCFSHGGIVVDWPTVIHAYRPEKAVGYGDASKGVLARHHLETGGSIPRQVRFFSIEKRL